MITTLGSWPPKVSTLSKDQQVVQHRQLIVLLKARMLEPDAARDPMLLTNLRRRLSTLQRKLKELEA